MYIKYEHRSWTNGWGTPYTPWKCSIMEGSFQEVQMFQERDRFYRNIETIFHKKDIPCVKCIDKDTCKSYKELC